MSEHTFDYKGASLREEIEYMIPQVLAYSYSLQVKDVAQMLMLFVLNDKARERQQHG